MKRFSLVHNRCKRLLVMNIAALSPLSRSEKWLVKGLLVGGWMLLAAGAFLMVLFLSSCVFGGSAMPDLAPSPLVSPLSEQDLATIICQISDFSEDSNGVWLQTDTWTDISLATSSPELVVHYLGNSFHKRYSRQGLGVGCHIYVYESLQVAQSVFPNLGECNPMTDLRRFDANLGEESCGAVGRVASVSTLADLAIRYEQVIIEIKVGGDSSLTTRQARELAEQLAEKVYARLLQYAVTP